MRVQEVKDISGALAALVSMSSTPGGAASKDDDSTDGDTAEAGCLDDVMALVSSALGKADVNAVNTVRVGG